MNGPLPEAAERRPPRLLRIGPVLGLALSTALLWSAEVRAVGAMEVSIEGCPMRADETTRLVKLELGSVLAAGSDASAYRVTLQCSGSDLRITIVDPLTAKSLARTVVAPPPSQPEPERLVALTVAQLYRASWLELAAEAPSPLPAAEPGNRPSEEMAAARIAAIRALEQPTNDRAAPSPNPAVASGASSPNPAVVPGAPASRSPVAPAPAVSGPASSEHRSWSLGVSLGARARHLESAVLFPSLEASVAWAPRSASLRLSVHGGVEWADIPRATGMLETLLVRAGIGLGMEPFASGPWSGLVEATGGLTHLTISGHAPRELYTGRQIGGPGFDGSVALGLSLRLDAIRFDALARVGLLVGTPTGLVAGDDDLSLDGPWTGAELRVRWGE